MFSKLSNVIKEGHASSDTPSEQEQSLATVLATREDRADLLLLIADSIEAMRGQIVDAFDPNKIDVATPLKIQRPADGQPEADLDLTVKAESADEEGLKQTTAVPAGKDEEAARNDEDGGEKEAGNDDEKADDNEDDKVEKAKKALEKRTRELSKPENVELKKAALNHFDDWRDKVMLRVGEAVNQKEDAEAATAHHGQLSRPTSNQESVTETNEDASPDPLQRVFPPLETPIRRLSEARRILIIHSILLLLLGLESYPAESRVLMLRLASSLGLSMELLAQDEISVAKGLLEVAKEQMNADAETKKKADENSTARKWKVGLGAVAGAVLIGVTGGLAAPLLAAGVGSVMGGLGLGATATAGYLGALAGSAPLVGVLFGAYGGRMTGQIIDEYAKEVEDFAFVPVNKPSLMQWGKHEDKDTRHLRVAVAISGWLVDKDEVVLPWKVISGRSTEAFALRWELSALLRLGSALNAYIKSYAWGYVKKEIISRTIFATLASALTLPYGLAKASRLIDNPFSVAMSRSDKAGRVLADALINKVQGERPVTLIGYSLGARVIYTCLNELAKRKAFGLVESVCLLGAPVPSDPIEWRRIRSVVAGRVVNVYSTKDFILAFLYRTNSLQYGVAGLQAIQDVQGIENVDVSDLVEGHTQYRFLVGSILQKLQLEDIDAEAVEKQLKKLNRKEKEDKEERARKQAEGKSAEDEADEMEKEVERKTKESQEVDRLGDKVSVIDVKQSPPAETVMTEEDLLREAEKR
ncbi:hypothetical protein SLS53_004791 [Cytospora paraplurivora]|uniref:DUF726-domain-containing protein n=1 Tax=Cytospora paraplurivora TaxID=2898453 RepID=A0AAN9YGN1_9PEZI